MQPGLAEQAPDIGVGAGRQAFDNFIFGGGVEVIGPLPSGTVGLSGSAGGDDDGGQQHQTHAPPTRVAARARQVHLAAARRC